MSIPHHHTEHLNDEIGFWIIAHVHKLDSHANWSAEWHSRRSDTGEINSGWLFRNYECDANILREFISRGIVTRCENAVTEHIFEDLLLELNEERREPNHSIWFELVIDTFTEQAVKFSISVWAYKYHFAEPLFLSSFTTYSPTGFGQGFVSSMNGSRWSPYRTSWKAQSFVAQCSLVCPLT